MFENDANFWSKVSAVLFVICIILGVILFGSRDSKNETSEKIEEAYWQGYHDAYDELSRKYHFDFEQ